MQRAQTRLKASERSLQQSEAKFVSLFQRSPVPLALISIQTDRMVEANGALLAQFGYTAEQFIGRTPQEIGIWANQDERAPYLALLTNQGFVDRYEVHLRCADNRVLTCLVSSRIIEAGGEMVSVFSPIDISHEREVEQEIRELNSELEQRVARRTVKLESALESVKNMQANLERMALTDELTGVPNRRHFLRQLEQEIARAKRYGRPLCVAMLDLDHFKLVNDRYGHSGGDEVLKHFSAFVRGQLRENDMLGRLGGEEFAVLLPETELNAAFFTLNRIVRELSNETVSQVATNFHYSFSCGLALFNLQYPDQAATTLLANADHALYQAKANGRNQVIVFEQPR
jgi:diguanylate cyclase (GGDEF)-like protein/PAS domain S-box-containing protein